MSEHFMLPVPEETSSGNSGEKRTSKKRNKNSRLPLLPMMPPTEIPLPGGLLEQIQQQSEANPEIDDIDDDKDDHKKKKKPRFLALLDKKDDKKQEKPEPKTDKKTDDVAIADLADTALDAQIVVSPEVDATALGSLETDSLQYIDSDRSSHMPADDVIKDILDTSATEMSELPEEVPESSQPEETVSEIPKTEDLPAVPADDALEAFASKQEAAIETITETGVSRPTPSDNPLFDMDSPTEPSGDGPGSTPPGRDVVAGGDDDRPRMPDLAVPASGTPDRDMFSVDSFRSAGIPRAASANAAHSHEHGHPRLALAFGAGLLIEHMLGKRADKRISTEMRERTDNLKKIIETQQLATHTQQVRQEAFQADTTQTIAQLEAALASSKEQTLQHQEDFLTLSQESAASKLNEATVSQSSVRSEAANTPFMRRDATAQRTYDAPTPGKSDVAPPFAPPMQAFGDRLPAQVVPPRVEAALPPILPEATDSGYQFLTANQQEAIPEAPRSIAEVPVLSATERPDQAYERQQESMRHYGGSQNTGGAGTGGAVPVAFGGQPISNEHSAPGYSAPYDGLHTQASRPHLTKGYKKAVQNGFLGAVGIIILSLLGYLILG